MLREFLRMLFPTGPEPKPGQMWVMHDYSGSPFKEDAARRRVIEVRDGWVKSIYVSSKYGEIGSPDIHTFGDFHRFYDLEKEQQ